MSRDDPENNFERVRLVFHDALDIPPAERESYLREVCAGDPGLLSEVKDLLEHLDRSDSELGSALVPRIGETLLTGVQLGPYQLGDLLGEGGMGVVYRATDTRTDEAVALKILRPDLSSHAVATRFRLEVQTLKRLRGEGIAQLLDAGSADHEGRKLNYYAMELVEGTSLRSCNFTDLPRIVKLAAAVCEAVGVAHAHGIIHRDLKPENIVVRDDDRPVVLDFGISRTVDPDGRTTNFVTSTGHVLGTVAYMSPEQLIGDSAATGAHSNVYSLGVLVFELLTGTRPFEHKKGSQTSVLTQASVLLAMERRDAPLASSRRSDLPPDLDAILAKSLERRPRDRYVNATAMADDLRAYLAGHTITAPRQTILRRGWSRVRRAPRRATILAAVALAVIAVAGVTTKVLQDRQEDRVVQTKLTELWSVLQKVEQDLHLSGTRTEESIHRALDNLEVSRGIVVSMPKRSFQYSLLRFIDWRCGEARYFLGNGTQDVQQYRLALGHWSDAHNYYDSTGADLKGLPERGQLHLAITYLTASITVGGRALACAAIGTFENRTEQLRLATHWRATAHRNFFSERDWESFSNPEFNVAKMVTLDYAISLIEYGIATDSLNVVERGVEMFESIDRDELWKTRGGAFSAGQFQVGKARQYRWQKSGDPGDWDRAEHRYRHSLGIRGEGSGSHLHARDRLQLARLNLQRGRRDALGTVARTRFLSARTELSRARGRTNLVPGSFERASADQLDAEISAEIARIDQDPLAFSRSESLLVAAESVYDRDKLPLQHAELQLARLFVLEASEPVLGSRDDEIREALTVIEVIVPGGIWPWLLRQAEEHRR